MEEEGTFKEINQIKSYSSSTKSKVAANDCPSPYNRMEGSVWGAGSLEGKHCTDESVTPQNFAKPRALTLLWVLLHGNPRISCFL